LCAQCLFGVWAASFIRFETFSRCVHIHSSKIRVFYTALRLDY
jgi:hypothetical protein